MLYPLTPVPSSTSAPAIIDKMISFESDSGYEVRRAITSRPRRRYTLEYLGMTTGEMRQIRDFLQLHRNGVMPFEWRHPVAWDQVTFLNTTPVILTFDHGLVTGQYVVIGQAPLAGIWAVTRLNSTQIALNGSAASGTSTVSVYAYLPTAVSRMPDSTWEAPAKIIGPESIGGALGGPFGGRTGYFSFSVSVEEVF
jgi:phage-related protein